MKNLERVLAETVEALLLALEKHPGARRFLAGDVGADAYAAFLGQTYLYVRQTRPLLRRAGERLDEMGAAPALAALFLQKSEEEDGHERWALADLAAIGRPIDEASPPPPSPAVAAYLAWRLMRAISRKAGNGAPRETPHNPLVPGSSPGGGAPTELDSICHLRAGRAQPLSRGSATAALVPVDSFAASVSPAHQIPEGRALGRIGPVDQRCVREVAPDAGLVSSSRADG